MRRWPSISLFTILIAAAASMAHAVEPYAARPDAARPLDATARPPDTLQANVPLPNVLLIMLDDFGYNDLGANGNPKTPTPNLDALAAQGTRYTRHYADATCSVARAALMTGTYPAVHGLRPTHLGLSADTPTIASMLRDAGYTTQHIGKWHIAQATLEQSPGQLGFDNWFGFLHQNELQGASSDGVHFLSPTYLDPWLRDNQSAPRQYPGHLTDILTERAIQFLDSQKAQARPWFLNLWYYAPHQPIEPAARFREKHPATGEGLYHALIEQLDSSIGAVLHALDRNGQGDNTLVIVVSDNGGTNAYTNNNHPFHGKKEQFNEGGLRTPLLMRWPGHVQSGAVSDDKVSLLDLFPTIAEASRATPPPHLVGSSLLNDGPRPGVPYYWEYSDSIVSTYSILSADGRWRYTAGTWLEPVLNDLVADPTGLANAIESHPDIAKQLRDDYLAWRLAARVVSNIHYEQLSGQGGAILRGDDLQRSPGRSGFTFAIGVHPAADDNGATQVIAEQPGRWRLKSSAQQGLVLDVLGQTLEGPPLPPGQCSELVISTLFKFSVRFPQNNQSIIGMYLNGKLLDTVTLKMPAPNDRGYANPTYIGANAMGEERFAGTLSRPVILNERVVPDAQSEPIGNGISGVPATCPDNWGQSKNSGVFTLTPVFLALRHR